MDRTSFHLPFTEQHVPKWPCPTCRNGHLTLAPKTLSYKQTFESSQDQDHEYWEPDWVRYVFSCLFTCSNADCKQAITCCGDGRVNYFEFEDDEHGWRQTTDDVFTPKYFNPPLVLMDIPANCPAEVTANLTKSFALYFADPGAALNCARAAVEALLTALGIKRFTIAKGKRRLIFLHQRIPLLPKKYEELKEMLLAVKWLGNAGSHDGDKLNSGDVRTTYDLLEHALSEIYEGKGKKLKAIAKKVNKKKGPLK
ncbi:DUF4145 domain-containing protein [Janthinobacterium lividum]|uniref:DUF4145 domain-containing protein n=1 Tax=Janthinobacterium lividum TaxID=29581 RepID=UPI00089414B0|nr:DUF4145 domain-containing protein [Janthinobacterium lividum]MCC7714688.1 DUF4145 domain-containing protein [Janthinobacterium lividum]OEZ56060.1 hypothetical protein JANLI_30140 [Janthinobacterium lividum]WQE30112.1 DUF4145 domain-containing protein [Janthinobacterium lividum]STQ95612.1 Uncharacterised protein [Janthinobacterium lividum]